MILNLRSLVEGDFETDPISVVNQSGKQQPLQLQVTSKGCLLIHPEEKVFIPIEMVQGIDSQSNQCLVTFHHSLVVPKHICFFEDRSILLRFQKETLQTFLKQINLVRIRTFIGSDPDIEKYIFRECRYCSLFINVTNVNVENSVYCPECQSIMSEEENLSYYKRYRFAHDKNGFFSLVGTNKDHSLSFSTSNTFANETLRERVNPVMDKIKAQALWSFLWVFLLILFWVIPFSKVTYVQLVLFFFLFGNLAIIGHYLCGLMMEGALIPLFKPPLWERLSKLIKNGEVLRAENAIKHHQLIQHPGHLINLALGFFHNKDEKKAWGYLTQAQNLCPNHPVVYSIGTHYAALQEKEKWMQAQKENDNKNILVKFSLDKNCLYPSN